MSSTIARSRLSAIGSLNGNKRRRGVDDAGDARDQIKRLRTVRNAALGCQEFGVLIPDRLRKIHGSTLYAGLETDKTTTEPQCRPISPDWIDALFLGDKGFFLASWYGVCYYIWRTAILHGKECKHAQQGGTSKALTPLSHLFGQMPAFCLPLPTNTTLDLTIQSYTYMYHCWYKTVFHSGSHKTSDQAFKIWIATYFSSRGIKDMTACWRRVGHFIQLAYLKWKEHPSVDETMAYLRATEQFWFREDYLVEEKGYLKLHVNVEHGPNGSLGWPHLFLQKHGFKYGEPDDNNAHAERAICFGITEPPRSKSKVYEQPEHMYTREDSESARREDWEFMNHFFDFDEASSEKVQALEIKSVDLEVGKLGVPASPNDLLRGESIGLSESSYDLATNPFHGHGLNHVAFDLNEEPINLIESFDYLMEQPKEQRSSRHDSLTLLIQ